MTFAIFIMIMLTLNGRNERVMSCNNMQLDILTLVQDTFSDKSQFGQENAVQNIIGRVALPQKHNFRAFCPPCKGWCKKEFIRVVLFANKGMKMAELSLAVLE